MKEQLERLKRSFASLEDIADDARAELVECQTEVNELKARLVELSATDDGDVSDFELEKTLFDAESLSTPGASNSPDDGYPRLDKLRSQDSASSPGSATCIDPTQSLHELKTMLLRLRSTLVRLFSAQCMQLL